MNSTPQEGSVMGTNVTKVEEHHIVQEDMECDNEEETDVTVVEVHRIAQDDHDELTEKRETGRDETKVDEEPTVQDDKDQRTNQEEVIETTEVEEQNIVQEEDDHRSEDEQEEELTEVKEHHIVHEEDEPNDLEEGTPEPPSASLKLGVVGTAQPVTRVRPRLQPYSTNQQMLRDATDEQLKILGLMKLKSVLKEYSVSGDAMLKLATLFNDVHKALSEKVVKLNRLETRLLMAEDAADCLSLHCGDSGFIWRIDKFNDKFKDAKNSVNPVLYSPAFMALGYTLALGLCPYGDGTGAKGKYMSIFFALLRGQNDDLQHWPFTCSVTFSLLGQSASDRVEDLVTTFVPDVTQGNNAGFLDRPTTHRNRMLGLRHFVSHADLWKENFVKEDIIYIRVEVTQSDTLGETKT